MKLVLWQWRVYDEARKRWIVTRHHMDEETARARYAKAEKVEGTMIEARDYGRTSDFLRPPTQEPMNECFSVLMEQLSAVDWSDSIQSLVAVVAARALHTWKDQSKAQRAADF